MIDIFNCCSIINDLFSNHKEKEARNELIKLLDFHEKNNIQYSNLVNHLIRQLGLYPYIDQQTALWQDKFIYEAFKVDIGDRQPQTLHKEQSSLLKKLLDGKSVIVSAPTSFGKSYIIDAFISIKKPQTVVIIVPTIALTDETRRRIYKRFSSRYQIITTPDREIKPDKNHIFIFPQERAFGYANKLKNIDLLVIDEFYKADETLDSERAINLKRIMMDLAPKAKQKYYLSPPISFEALKADNNMFTKDMECIPLDFNTVISEISYEYKKQELKDRNLKNKRLLEIIQSKKTKTLIYAGTYNKIKEVSDILLSALPDKDNAILDSFSDWLKNNYGQNYPLSALIKKGTGIHNGQLHRALAQIQVRLFEEEDCINNIISTSSIIEGVNTSTENVIIWSNKNGTAKLNNFTYKNIIGRGGRMFRHFVGKIYIFEAPPNDDSTELTLSASEDFLKSSDTEDFKQDLTKDQIKEIIDFNKEMDALLGEGNYDKLKKEKQLLSIKPSELLNVAKNMKKNPKNWERLKYLNFNNPQSWRSPIHLVLQTLNLQIEPYSLVIKAVQYFSHNWRKTIPQILEESGISIDKFFKIERYAAFKLASTLNDINIIYKLVAHSNIDISPFIAKLSHAFLPKHVYELEEYGLPRMLSKKIQESGIIDLEKSESDIQNIIDEFINIRQETLEKKITNLHPFESYILKFFYDGITSIH